MKTKSTIAIIGNHHVMDEKTMRFLFDSGQRLLHLKEGQCAVDASWEADLVLLNVAPSELKKTCLEIQPVVTQKTMIVVINNEEAVQLRTWFPDTELLTVSETGEIAGLVNHFMAQF